MTRLGSPGVDVPKGGGPGFFGGARGGDNSSCPAVVACARQHAKCACAHRMHMHGIPFAHCS